MFIDSCRQMITVGPGCDHDVRRGDRHSQSSFDRAAPAPTSGRGRSVPSAGRPCCQRLDLPDKARRARIGTDHPARATGGRGLCQRRVHGHPVDIRADGTPAGSPNRGADARGHRVWPCDDGRHAGNRFDTKSAGVDDPHIVVIVTESKESGDVLGGRNGALSQRARAALRGRDPELGDRAPVASELPRAHERFDARHYQRLHEIQRPCAEHRRSSHRCRHLLEGLPRGVSRGALAAPTSARM